MARLYGRTKEMMVSRRKLITEIDTMLGDIEGDHNNYEDFRNLLRPHPASFGYITEGHIVHMIRTTATVQRQPAYQQRSPCSSTTRRWVMEGEGGGGSPASSTATALTSLSSLTSGSAGSTSPATSDSSEIRARWMPFLGIDEDEPEPNKSEPPRPAASTRGPSVKPEGKGRHEVKADDDDRIKESHDENPTTRPKSTASELQGGDGDGASPGGVVAQVRMESVKGEEEDTPEELPPSPPPPTDMEVGPPEGESEARAGPESDDSFHENIDDDAGADVNGESSEATTVVEVAAAAPPNSDHSAGEEDAHGAVPETVGSEDSDIVFLDKVQTVPGRRRQIKKRRKRKPANWSRPVLSLSTPKRTRASVRNASYLASTFKKSLDTLEQKMEVIVADDDLSLSDKRLSSEVLITKAYELYGEVMGSVQETDEEKVVLDQLRIRFEEEMPLIEATLVTALQSLEAEERAKNARGRNHRRI